jgi:hypothetical protein
MLGAEMSPVSPSWLKNSSQKVGLEWQLQPTSLIRTIFLANNLELATQQNASLDL